MLVWLVGLVDFCFGLVVMLVWLRDFAAFGDLTRGFSGLV